MMKLRPPSPALVVAVIALFVALSGTAVAAGIVARAQFANNAGKLQGKTARQVAAMPGPATAVSSLVSTASAPFSLGPDAEQDVTVPCPAGTKAISGGFTTPNSVLSMDTRPSANGAGWSLYLINLSSTEAASGTAQAICLK
jgi:hypothetical protein